MKKVINLGVTVASLFLLAGCGSSNSSSKNSSKSSDSNTHVVKTQKKKDRYFENNYLKLEDFTLKITKTSVIPAGQKGNDYSKKPIFAIWYTVKNTSGKRIDATVASSVLEASQATKSTDHELDNAIAPDDELMKTQSDVIKKGKTAKGAMAWELSSTKTPIKVRATPVGVDSTVGTQTYKIQ
ncbi:DUF5067 domain-containing protein [Lactobacillus parabuchneri]|jgi:hypothetical protein|uniref:DUF5067 domain-containing protein n=1 Tax=Lentilactobacillus parabuchneri TaxID=152331 RepID=A0A844EAC7_9LACO|nr:MULTISPECIES: DUF5067 domain-containing protein [Lentilactobacillus]MDB1104731.1 DUF5067 domain-containing protein [Lentilactobacillus parabuchneri]MSE19715.1 DUF5067 domain-containing protein [Lentilactobacillus parabuchneri]MSE19777.1 DUF5067 domain-containing protein [Lentilactobacillus parabuchneri]